MAVVVGEQRGNITVENVPGRDPLIAERLAAYQNTRGAAFKGFAHPEGLLISTRFADTPQVHFVRNPLGTRRQLTFFDEPVKSCKPTPPSAPRRGFVFGMDTGGDEQIQLYFFDWATGRRRLLTDGASKHMGSVISGGRIVFSGNGRDKARFDLYVADLPAGAPDASWAEPLARRCVFEAPASGYFWPESFHGDFVLFRHYTSITDAVYYLLDVSDTPTPSGRPRQPVRVFPPEGESCSVDCGELWVSDGEAGGNRNLEGGVVQGVIFSSDQGGEFSSLRYWSRDSGEVRVVVPTDEVPWSVESIAVDATGSLAVVAYNEDGCSTFYRLSSDAAGGPQSSAVKLNFGLSLGEVGHMEFREPNPDVAGFEFGFSFLSSKGPSETYTVRFSPNGTEELAVRWTESEVGGLDTDTFVDPELVRVPSFDGLPIPFFVYRPPNSLLPANGRFPVVVHPHGGPEGQHRPGFLAIIQYLVVEMGIAVIDPNVRGSDGYGKTFVSLDNGFNREDSVKDMGAVFDWVKEQPNLDPDRLAVWGGSYGGYMVLAGLVHYSDRLRCAVDVVGISNFVTFLENTSEYRRDQRRVKYGDERDPKMREHLQAISPLTNASKMQRPLFIVQGAKDPRVPLSEAEQIRDAVRAAGQEVWYMVAADEGHGFAKKGNRDQYQEALVAFFRKHLLA